MSRLQGGAAVVTVAYVGLLAFDDLDQCCDRRNNGFRQSWQVPCAAVGTLVAS